jgi:hypothetical protein
MNPIHVPHLQKFSKFIAFWEFWDETKPSPELRIIHNFCLIYFQASTQQKYS